MKIFGYFTLSLLVASAIACQDATLSKAFSKGHQLVAEDQILNYSELIKGSWQETQVSDMDTSMTASEDGFVAQVRTTDTFDGSRLKTVYEYKGNAVPEKVDRLYTVNGDSIALAPLESEDTRFIKILSVTADTLELQEGDSITKLKRVVLNVFPTGEYSTH